MSTVDVLGAILFPRKYAIGGIPIDVFINEAHVSEVGITQNPVEFGLAVTDNIVAQPFRVTVEGIITTAENGAILDWGIQGFTASTANLLSAALGLDLSFGGKVSGTWEALVTLQRSGERMSLATGIKQYENMAIVSLATAQNKDSPEHLRFIAMLQEVVIIDTSFYQGSLGDIAARPESRNETAKTNQPTADRGAAIKEGGTSQGIEVPKKDVSILKQIYSGISGAINQAEQTILIKAPITASKSAIIESVSSSKVAYATNRI
ncbi:MAG: hypothetical protein DRH08_07950 [Deltaproteobacteria bacterium]|nr:MAG: hypothetical protein DRH08_07950 [Deltaproteobacteria bacterium]